MSRHYIFGEFIEKEAVTARDIKILLERAQEIKEVFQSYPILNIIRIFSRLRERWLDPQYPPRQKALALMPQIARFHPAMIKLGLEALGDLLKAEHLNKKLLLELGGKEYLDRWSYSPEMQGYLLAQPRGVLLHVAPSNVFVSAVDSLIHGMITKNINILKLSNVDPVFPLLFAESLKEADTYGILSSSFAIVDFRGGDKEIEHEFKKGCNGIVVWGGEETVLSYRENLPVTTKLIEYGPKYSFSILTQLGLTQLGLSSTTLEQITNKIAHDIAIWEQRACSAPQVVFIEMPSHTPIDPFLEKLSNALANKSNELPQGDLSLDEAVEITKARELGKFQEIFNEGKIVFPKGSCSWTIIYEKSPTFRISPLNRTIYVKTFQNLEEILGPMEGFGGYLQTVGILASPQETTKIARRLASFGCTRITEIGKMGEGKIGAPHDGTYQLEELIKWVSIEKERKPGEIFLEEEDPYESPPVWEQLKEILEYARVKSPFYAKRLKGVLIEDWEDIEKLPLLTRDDIYEHAPPRNHDILTAPLRKAYVFGSGGTTGKPKYIFYYYDELNEGTNILAKIYRIAGITQGDVVANLFMAGNLWTSFIAVNKALEDLGCVNLPIAGNIDMEQTIHYLKTFNVNVLMGIPSIIIALAEELEKQKIGDVHIEKILYGGEHFSPEAKEYVQKITGCKRIVSAGYASVDGGPVGYQCPFSEGSLHHLLTVYQYMEIIDLETGKKIKPYVHESTSKAGEIVLTNLSRHLMPVIRYRTGDMGRWLNVPCKCTRVSPLFELLGRCDERIRVGTVDIYSDAIDNAIGKVSGLSHIFQVIADKKEHKDCLIIKVEEKGVALKGRNLRDTKNRLINKEEVAIKEKEEVAIKEKEEVAIKEKEEQIKALKNEILLNSGELKEALREGWLGDLQIEIVAQGEIPRVPRTGKIQRVIDLRKK